MSGNQAIISHGAMLLFPTFVRGQNLVMMVYQTILRKVLGQKFWIQNPTVFSLITYSYNN